MSANISHQSACLDLVRKYCIPSVKNAKLVATINTHKQLFIFRADFRLLRIILWSNNEVNTKNTPQCTNLSKPSKCGTFGVALGGMVKRAIITTAQKTGRKKFINTRIKGESRYNKVKNEITFHYLTFCLPFKK